MYPVIGSPASPDQWWTTEDRSYGCQWRWRGLGLGPPLAKVSLIQGRERESPAFQPLACLTCLTSMATFPTLPFLHMKSVVFCPGEDHLSSEDSPGGRHVQVIAKNSADVQ